jgi:S1-C subfamily serine protease
MNRYIWLMPVALMFCASIAVRADEIDPAYCGALRDLAVQISNSMRTGTSAEAAVAWASSHEKELQPYLEDPRPVLRPLVYYVYGFQQDPNASSQRIGSLVYDQCQNGTYGTVRPRKQAKKTETPGASKPPPASDEDVYSLGTGWPAAEGLVVTNNHVIAGHNDITLITTSGRRIHASVLSTDSANDLALLAPDDSKDLPPALTIVKGPAPIGSEVFTIGYPHPDIMGSKPKLTTGVVNAETGLHDDPRTYQISVAVQSGNSGGPLIDMKGEVVGVVTSKLSAVRVFQWTGDLPQNVNYAMKSKFVISLLKDQDMDMVLKEIPPKKSSLQDLARRIENSILIVVAH